MPWVSLPAFDRNQSTGRRSLMVNDEADNAIDPLVANLLLVWRAVARNAEDIVGLLYTFAICACRSRASIKSTAMVVISIPIHRRPSFCAASMAVPQPAKGSSTTSSFVDDVAIMRSSSASGFWVGYPNRSFAIALIGAMSSHRLSTVSPGRGKAQRAGWSS